MVWYFGTSWSHNETVLLSAHYRHVFYLRKKIPILSRGLRNKRNRGNGIFNFNVTYRHINNYLTQVTKNNTMRAIYFNAIQFNTPYVIAIVFNAPNNNILLCTASLKMLQANNEGADQMFFFYFLLISWGDKYGRFIWRIKCPELD